MTTLLFLPTAGYGYRWLRLAADGSFLAGDGVPTTDDAIIAVAPAESVTLHWADLPARSPAQAAAAARLLVAEASATPLAELHVAVGHEGEGGGESGGERPIAVVAMAVVAGWLIELADRGIDPDAIVPAPLLLPRPEAGYVRATIAGASIVRGRSAGFADEAGLTALVIGDGALETLDQAAVDGAVVAAAANPPLNLRQGPFAQRRRVGIDWPLVRRLVSIAAAILLVTLGIDLVRIAKYSFGADALEARADALGRTGLARGETVTDVDRQLTERLAAVRGPGLGFSTTAAAVYAAMRATPGTELTGLDFQPNGDIRLMVAAARESLPTDLKRTLEAAGFAVTPGVFQSSNGKVSGEMTVSRR